MAVPEPFYQGAYHMNPFAGVWLGTDTAFSGAFHQWGCILSRVHQ